MNIKNIALVRATNVIPFDKIVHPVSNVPYIKKEKGTSFAYAINDLLREKGIINREGYWTLSEEEQIKVDRKNREILEEYLPYNSDYNSMVLWSLNGLVPDDMNNIFSNKTCAIIESLEEQIDNAEFISLVPTDTAIKGDIKLSNKAIIMISKERYEALSEKEKKQLEAYGINVQIFEGDLQKKVFEVLDKDENYTAEQLTLIRKYRGYVKSETSDELIETIQNIAESHGIAQELFFNIMTGQSDELDKLSSVKEEYDNNVKVEECYKKTFFNYLFSKLNIDEEVKYNVLSSMESPEYMKNLTEEIDRIGLDKYKEIVQQYNKTLEILKEEGKLLTPEEIVKEVKKDKSFTLNYLIKQKEKSKSEQKREDFINSISNNGEFKNLQPLEQKADELKKEKIEQNKNGRNPEV